MGYLGNADGVEVESMPNNADAVEGLEGLARVITTWTKRWAACPVVRELPDVYIIANAGF